MVKFFDDKEYFQKVMKEVGIGQVRLKFLGGEYNEFALKSSVNKQCTEKMSYLPRNQLILSTIYNLNTSFAKQVAVGAEFDKNGYLAARVKLMSSHLQAYIISNPEDWKLFSSFFKEMRIFFNNKIV